MKIFFPLDNQSGQLELGLHFEKGPRFTFSLSYFTLWKEVVYVLVFQIARAQLTPKTTPIKVRESELNGGSSLLIFLTEIPKILSNLKRLRLFRSPKLFQNAILT